MVLFLLGLVQPIDILAGFLEDALDDSGAEKIFPAWPSRRIAAAWLPRLAVGATPSKHPAVPPKPTKSTMLALELLLPPWAAASLPASAQVKPPPPGKRGAPKKKQAPPSWEEQLFFSRLRRHDRASRTR